MRKVSAFLITLWLLGGLALAQVPVSLMPQPCPQFTDSNGKPLASGKVFTYQAGTSNPLATYTDSTGTVQNSNPIILNQGGFPQAASGAPCGIWLSLNAYKIVVQNVFNVPIWTVDNVSDPGFFYTTKAVLLNPAGGALQTITGPLQANYFQQSTTHFTSPGVRVSVLDPLSTLDTATNPPFLTTYNPLASGQNYNIPDPQTPQSSFVLSPGSSDWQASTSYAAQAIVTPNVTTNPCGFSFVNNGSQFTSGTSRPTFSALPCATSFATVSDNGGTWTSQGLQNALDCTKSGLSCKRTAYFYLEGAGCNNATAGLAWDNFGTNAPTPICVTGTNIQKGVLAFPSAATRVQENSATASAAASYTVSYPAATAAGDLLEVEIAVDGSKTVSSVTDGTNAYSKAVSIANGSTDLEIWYFNGNSAGMAASTNLTITLSGAANSACDWKEYNGIVTASMLDRTATNTGSGTAVSTGGTANVSQNTELVIAALASPSNPTVTPASTGAGGGGGWVGHSTVSQSTNVTTFGEGTVLQTGGSITGTATLSTSQNWAAAVATFKANVQGSSSAQRQIALPQFYDNTRAVNSAIKWQTPQKPTGTVNVALAAAIVCTADGSTDDPAFNTATTATPAVSQTGPVITTTSLSSLSQSGCSPSNLLHYQIQRLRYNSQDTFEGWVYVDGASLQFGITQ